MSLSNFRLVNTNISIVSHSKMREENPTAVLIISYNQYDMLFIPNHTWNLNQLENCSTIIVLI